MKTHHYQENGRHASAVKVLTANDRSPNGRDAGDWWKRGEASPF